MDRDTNPYSSPIDANSVAADENGDQPLSMLAKRIFLDWEKLRLAYIAILGLVTIVAIFLRQTISSRLVVDVVMGAVLANACFFAGPIVETYIRWLGYQAAWPRWAMFAIGTIFACGLAVLAVLMATGPF